MRSRFASSAGVILFVLVLTATLGVAAPVGAATANAGPASARPAAAPSASPFGSADDLLALLAVQQAQLTAGDGAANDSFGFSVAISGDTAVVGAYYDDVGANTNQGSAYVFVRSGSTWSQQTQLTASDGAANDDFGRSVATSGDTVVVGADCDDAGANTDQGSAYVFVRNGTTWSEQQKLTAGDGAASDRFGYSVALSSDTAVVGAALDDVGANMDQGSAYVFVRSGTTWSQQAQLAASDGAAGDECGDSVATVGETAVVGTPSDDVGATLDQGSAYVFVRSGTTWSEHQKLIAADGVAGDYFGGSVAISGDSVVAGAGGGDVGANTNQGSAYVFVRSGTTWSQQAKLTASDGAAGDRFGYPVAISDDTVVVGAIRDDVGTNADQGSAYVFVRSGTTCSQRAHLTAADGAADDWFGCSVGLSNDTTVVGSCLADVGTSTDQGSAYVFGIKPGKPVAKSPKGLIAGRTPTFKWMAAALAASYEVRIYKGSRLMTKKTGITKLSWKCTRRLPRKVWLTWKVRADNAVGAGPWSARPRFKVR
jgi:hypothetical protein